MGLFSKKPSQLSNQAHAKEALLDQKLYTVPTTNTDITWADSIEATLITGNTGSGKSSGPGKHIALSMLKSDFGFCVLCAKPDEAKIWQNYAQITGRQDDLVIFNKNSGLKFNFLKYEMERAGQGAGDVLNIINALMNLNEQNKIHQSGGHGKEERFWDNSLRRLMSRTIGLLSLAGEEVGISNMRRLVSESFLEDDVLVYEEIKDMINTKEQIDPQKREHAEHSLESWVSKSFFVKLIEKINEGDDTYQVELVRDYWLKEFAKISERTRSIIVESFMGIIEPFLNKGILRDLFSQGLSEVLQPENIVKQHKIVIIDFPIKEYGISAVYAASIYKTTFQAAMERRDIDSEDNPQPVGLWIDEYQSFCSPITDSLFQSTARSSWVATVYITQNINNLYFVMGSNMPTARAKSLLGNMNLKYFCCNADIETNSWASNIIGKHMVYVGSIQVNKDKVMTKTRNERLLPRITPDYFTTLKTGRKINSYKVQAVVFKAGKTWGEEKNNFAVVKFVQN